MGVIGGILVFVVGLTAGLLAAAGIAILIHRIITPIKQENRRLETCAWEDCLKYQTRKAYQTGYHRGYLKGRDDPLTDVERLASTLRKRNVDFRTGPARERSEN